MRNGYGVLLLALSMIAAPLYARIYYVDDDAPGDPLPFDRRVGDRDEDGSPDHPFDSIQEAIDTAGGGETIVVAPGRYISPDTWLYDEIRFEGKSIRLISSAPTDFRVIRETVLCGVVVFRGDEGPECLLQGFKIQNHGHGGILGNDTEAVVSHCIISGNGPCGATVIMDVQGPITNCLIVDNTTAHDCGVLPVVSGCRQLVNCTIANNLSGVGIAGGESWRVGLITFSNVIDNCIIYGNQGSQLVYPQGGFEKPRANLSHCLIQGWSSHEPLIQGSSEAIQDADPCFVQVGYWAGETLLEGDYHLRSEGWRWSEQEVHDSHWYFDASTSPAIDAGDPMESLGEEPERVPQDPEGRWGFNHAINLGAYAGTAQASLAPTEGAPPGVGAVDLRDYWPFAVGNKWSRSEGDLLVTLQLNVNGYPVHVHWTFGAPEWSGNVYCVYVDRILHMTHDTAPLNLLPQLSEQMQAQYPQYPIVGSTVETPYDPLAEEAPPRRPAIVMRGTLADVIADTGLDPSQFVSGPWPDVIAFRERTRDGAPGEPITIFARGFGPLMLAGQPIERAIIGETVYTTEGTRTMRRETR